MNDGQGQNIVVSVPTTWAPIDLTNQATKKAILTSPNFRRMLSNRMLLLVSNEVAEVTMNETVAQKETQRINSRVSELAFAAENMPVAAQKALAESDGTVSGMAMQMALGADLDEDQVLTTLQGNLSTMSDSDLKYIVNNSRFARVKEMAAQALNQTS